MKKTEVFEITKSALIDALGIDEDTVITPDSKLIDDLGAESIDFLDIMSRLERRFDVNLDSGEDVEEKIMELVPEEEMETGEFPLEVLEELPKLMPEIDPAEFKEGLCLNDLPRLFTVDSMMKTVMWSLQEQKHIEIEDGI